MTSRLVVDTIQASTLGGNMVTIPTGQKLYAPGHVIQVVQATSDTYTTGSNSTWVQWPVSATILPTSVNSRILVQFIGTCVVNSANDILHRLKRNITPINISSGTATIQGTVGTYSAAGVDWQHIPIMMMYLDSPGTTSATTYYAESYLQSGAATIYMNRTSATSGGDSGATIATMILMEIGG